MGATLEGVAARAATNLPSLRPPIRVLGLAGLLNHGRLAHSLHCASVAMGDKYHRQTLQRVRMCRTVYREMLGGRRWIRTVHDWHFAKVRVLCPARRCYFDQSDSTSKTLIDPAAFALFGFRLILLGIFNQAPSPAPSLSVLSGIPCALASNFGMHSRRGGSERFEIGVKAGGVEPPINRQHSRNAYARPSIRPFGSLHPYPSHPARSIRMLSARVPACCEVEPDHHRNNQLCQYLLSLAHRAVMRWLWPERSWRTQQARQGLRRKSLAVLRTDIFHQSARNS